MNETTCFLVIVEDRHIDTECFCFTDKTKAIEYTKKILKLYQNSEEQELSKDMLINNWVFFANLSCEGGMIHIIKSTINPK